MRVVVSGTRLAIPTSALARAVEARFSAASLAASSLRVTQANIRSTPSTTMANLARSASQNQSKPARPGGKSGRSSAPAPTQFTEPRCKVCTSAYRAEIENLARAHWSDAAIMRHINARLRDDEVPFNASNIGRHFNNGHVLAETTAIRRMIESRARQFKVDVESAEDTILTKAGAMDVLIHKGLKALEDGDTVVEPKDVITAIQLLTKLEQEWGETALDELLNEFRIFTEAVKEVVGEDMHAEIFERFETRLDSRRNPILDAPKVRELGPADPAVIEGEVADEVDEADDGSS